MWRRVSSISLLALAFMGCADEPAPASGCVPGLSVECRCDDGRAGARTCDAARTFGACVCAVDAAPPDVGEATEDRPDVAVRDAPEKPDVPAVQDAPEVSLEDVVDVFDVVDAGEVPDAAAVIDAGDVRDAPDAPDVRDAPDVYDAPTVTDVPDAGRVLDPCAPTAVIDVNAVGTRSGGTTRVYGTNLFAPVSRAHAAPVWCSPRAGRVVVYRYAPSAATRVRVSVAQAPSPNAAFNSAVKPVAWFLDRCAPGATVMACAENWGAGATTNVAVTTPRRVAAGEAVYVAVALLDDAAGYYELVVRELQAERPVGAICDLNQNFDTCAPDSECVNNRESTDTRESNARCVPYGARLGRCRLNSAAPCDPGLACTDFPGRRRAVCVPGVAVGEECHATECVEGACSPVSGAWRCVRDGAFQGRCRRTGAPCDAGLACSGDVWLWSSRCMPPIAVGGACAVNRPGSACVAGAVCVARAANTASGTCAQLGALDGPCRADDPPCDAGLACARTTSNPAGRCRPALADGAACTATSATDPCATGSWCVAGRCQRDGAPGARCRALWPQCESGFTCGYTPAVSGGTCVPTIPSGASGCTGTTPRTNECEVGSLCVAGGVCQRAGTEDVFCRPNQRDCDPGLACGASARCFRVSPEGGRCDTQRLAELCGDGMGCVASSSGARCTVDGRELGRCRVGATTCDAGLVCGRDGFCHAPLPYDGRCSDTAPCAPGLQCLISGSATGSCRTPGQVGGECRAEFPGVTPCAPGLGCPYGICLNAVAVGARCTGTETCPYGSDCDLSVTQTCVPDGAINGRCRSAGPRCDPGGVCDTFHCVREVAVGATCNLYAVCTAGATCTGAGCQRNGAVGLGCDAGSPLTPCVAGAGCSRADTRCVVARTDGTCDTGTAVCPAGQACVNGRCEAPAYAVTVTPGATAIDVCAERGEVALNPSSSLPVPDAVALPFALRWFGETVRTLWLTPFGSGTFRDTAPSWAFLAYGESVGPTGAAAYFSMYPGRVTPSDWSPAMVCVRTLGAAPARQVAIEWRAAFPHPSTRVTLPLDLLAVLHESGVVEFRYLRVPTGPTQPLGLHANVPVGGNVAVFPFAPSGPTTITFTPR